MEYNINLKNKIKLNNINKICQLTKRKGIIKKNNFYRNEQTKELEKNIKDDERELQAIKDAFEKGNYEGLGKLPLKVDKFKRISQGKVPKELSEKQKKKREEMNLKYVENLEKEQKRLFKDRAGRKNKIDPIKKIEITNYENAFLKECREVFSKDNKSNTNNKKNQNTEKNNNENINNNNNKTQKQKSNNPSSSRLSSKKENRVKNNNEDSMRVTHEKIEIECDTDAQLDEQFLKKLNDEDRDLYENQTGKIFELLKSIHLGRFIENFILETYDNYDDFINLPKNFFKLLDEPFLNPAQQKKLYNKIHEVKKQSKEKKKEEQSGIIPATEIINNIKKNQIQQKKQNDNIQKQKKENKIFENTIIDTKNNNNNNKTNNKIEENNNEENEIKNHINELKKEEIDPDLLEIEELERKQAEEFKKAVEDFRNGNINNKIIMKSENGMTAKENDMIKTDVNQSEILCCWNCFKPIKKEETIFKNFNAKDDQNILFKKKSFCSMKCFKEFEVKKKSTIICFQCEKQFDIKNGFILYDRQKFCSTKCKEEYINDNNLNEKNSKNETIKSKDIENENDDISENDDYDPMNDF